MDHIHYMLVLTGFIMIYGYRTLFYTLVNFIIDPNQKTGLKLFFLICKLVTLHFFERDIHTRRERANKTQPKQN